MTSTCLPNVRLILLSSAASILAFVPHAAAAQAASAPAAAAAEGGDIIVTARKSSERLQDIPVSVSAVTADQLQARGAADLKDVLRDIPGLSYAGTQRGLSNYNIRGISTTSSSPTVGVYLDDISLTTIATTFSGAYDPVFFDMERVEVLKGPQGTLYGGSAMGGAIKYVSARPKLNRTEVSLAAGGALTSHGAGSTNGEAVVNLPLAQDTLAVRAGAYFRHEGGFIDNRPGTIENSHYSSTAFPAYTPLVQNSLSTLDKANQNSVDSFAVRASLEWEPDPSWSIRPQLLYDRSQRDNSDRFFFSMPALTSSYRIHEPTTDRNGIYSLSIDKRLGGVKATSLTAYYDRDLNFVRDYSFFVGGLVPALYGYTSSNVSHTRTKTFSQEVRLASDSGENARLRWLIGAYYSNQNDRLRNPVTTIGAGAILGTGTDIVYYSNPFTNTRQYAVFGEATFTLFPHFDITGGLRAFKINQTVNLDAGGLFNGGTTVVKGLRSRESGVNPKFGASYKPTPNSLIYASAAKGFRPGGPNRFVIDPHLCAADLTALGLAAPPKTFESDSLWTYELGTKNTIGDHVATLNAAAFYSNWKKIQQQVQLASCGSFFTDNVGSAVSRGVEIEGQVNLTRALRIGGSATYTDAHITKAATNTPAQQGDRIQGVPEWMANAYANYRFAIGSGWSADLNAEYQYQGNARFSFSRTLPVSFPGGVNGVVPNYAEFRQSYHVANLYASFSHGDLSFRLYANNILDAHPLIDFDPTSGSDYGATIRPRTVGFEVRKKF